MKSKKISHFLLVLVAMSSIATIVSIIYLKINFNQSKDTNSIVKPLVQQKEFSQDELNYLTYVKNNQRYFYKKYFQFLILQDLSLHNPELLKQGIEFKYDNLENPTSVQVVIDKNENQVWNYSIINK